MIIKHQEFFPHTARPMPVQRITASQPNYHRQISERWQQLQML